MSHRPLPRTLTRWFACLLMAACTSLVAHAQAGFPSKDITVIVPFAAGGPTDFIARKLAAELSVVTGQTVTVSNVSGLGGTVGARKAADAAPDGYTLLLHHIGMATAPALFRRLSYDPQKDFEPIGLVADSPMLLLSAPNLPIRDPKGFVGYVKTHQASLSVAYAGVGSASHLCGLLLASVLRVDFFSVPYTGTGPALADLERGRADLLCDQTTSAMKAVRAGKVVAHGITSPQRLASVQDVPTMAESGMPGLQLSIWHALYAPRQTPSAVVDTLSRALQTAVASPAFVSAMAESGAVAVTPRQATPVSLKNHLAQQTAQWRPIIVKAGQFAD